MDTNGDEGKKKEESKREESSCVIDETRTLRPSILVMGRKREGINSMFLYIENVNVCYTRTAIEMFFFI